MLPSFESILVDSHDHLKTELKEEIEEDNKFDDDIISSNNRISLEFNHLDFNYFSVIESLQIISLELDVPPPEMEKV